MLQKDAVKPSEAAAMLSVGRKRLQRLLDEGEIPSLRFGPRTVRIPVEGLRAWLRQRSTSDHGGDGA